MRSTWLLRPEHFNGMPLRRPGATGDRVYFVCPCGGGDHYAVRKYIPAGVSAYLSPVLNCYEKGLQWMVKPIPVADIIEHEEEVYLRLLEKAATLVPNIIHKLGYSLETLGFIWETHGIPEDVVDSICREEQERRK